jgi:acyl-CoA thioesterase
VFAADNGAAALGVRLSDCDAGTATLAMTVTETMVNGYSMTHGGYVVALADTAFAVACNNSGRKTVATGAVITFLSPTTVGDELMAEAVERARRGRSGIYDVTVRCRGAVVAEFRGSSRELPG